MAKGSAKKKTASSSTKHQNFKLTPHGHPKDKVMLYVVISILIGLAIGWFFRGQVIAMLGGNPALY